MKEMGEGGKELDGKVCRLEKRLKILYYDTNNESQDR